MKKSTLFLSIFCLLVFASGVSYADSERIQNPNNDHWYQRFDTSMPWHTAKDFCESIGGYLATITSQEEQNFVYSQLVSNSPHWCWLGATDEAQEGVWKWVTGEPWNYINWNTGEPNNCSGIENYLMIFSGADPRASLWNDLGSYNNGGCGCGCPSEFYLMSTICEWATPPWSGPDKFPLKFTSVYGDASGNIRFKKFTKIFTGTIELWEFELIPKQVKFSNPDGTILINISSISSIKTSKLGHATDEIILIGTGDFSIALEGVVFKGLAYLDGKGTLKKDASGIVNSIDLNGNLAGGANSDLVFEGDFQGLLVK